MTDPVAGSFTGLHARVYFDDTPNYVVTKGGYDLEQLFDNPWPSGDPMEHNVPCGFKLNSLYVEKQMLDDESIRKLMTATPSTGGAGTLKSSAAVTAGTEIAMTTPNTTPALIRATLNTNPTTAGGYLLFIADDYTTDKVAVGASDAAGTTYTSTRAMNCIACLPIGVVTTGTLTFTSLAGATTYGPRDGPGDVVKVEMRLTHPSTGEVVKAIFDNCYHKKTPVDWQSGKTISNKIELVMQNGSDDMQFQNV